METLIENGNKDKSVIKPDLTGESMKDSMSESAPGNDNALLPNANEITDANGELDPEVFKKTYQQPDHNSSTRE